MSGAAVASSHGERGQAARACGRVAWELERFDVADYVAQAREHGRARLPARTRERAGVLHRSISELRASELALPRALDDAVELARHVLLPERSLAHERTPRYRTYTNMGVLNWYLGTGARTSYQKIWERCASAIRILLDDLIEFERDSLAGFERRSSDSFDRDAVEERVAQLQAIADAFAWPAATRVAHDRRPPAAWERYLEEGGAELALVHLTAFPLTSEHDEYTFIRTLQISECCFWAILTAALSATERLKRGDVALAARRLDVALAFARMLTPMIRALKTMSGARFEIFREATGSASALQSRSYQLMQIALTGAHPASIGVLADVPELADLRHYDQPRFMPLSALAAPLYQSSAREARRLVRALDELDLELRKWRKVHRGIVRRYLAERPTGTGGTDGAGYLEHTVDTTIAGAAREWRGRARDRRACRSHARSQTLLWRLTPASGHARAVLSAED